MIVKVQVPLASNMPLEQQEALIYNEDRSLEVTMPITPELLKLMDGQPKVYVNAMLVKGKLSLLDLAARQAWNW